MIMKAVQRSWRRAWTRTTLDHLPSFLWPGALDRGALLEGIESEDRHRPWLPWRRGTPSIPSPSSILSQRLSGIVGRGDAFSNGAEVGSQET